MAIYPGRVEGASECRSHQRLAKAQNPFFKQLVIFSSVRCGSARLGILGAVFQPDEAKIKNIFGKVKVILYTLANV